MFDINHSFLFIVAGIIIFYVFLQSLVFLILAWRQAKRAGLDMAKLRSTAISTAVFSIVPAISIIIGMISLSKFLGVPLPWVRLSVIGALTYELPAAITAASVTETPITETITDPSAYANIAWIMTCGILSGTIIITFFSKHMQKGLVKLKGKDKKWGRILVDSLFLGMISAFLGMIFSRVSEGLSGWIPVFVMIISSLIMIVCGFFVKVKKVTWLENYAMPISMICAMIFAIPLTTLIQGL
ncbi:MAG: DUF5058 family protein [Treponemataceae bacterium]